MDSYPTFVSPALPPDLLWFIIHSCTYPTTLIVCSSRNNFLASLTESVLTSTAQNHDEQDEKKRQYSLLGVAPLYQIAVARHIRIVFVPTVSHLRAFLSVFSVDGSKVPPPPAGVIAQPSPVRPMPEKGNSFLLIYGFLNIHRHTSEWSVQGLSNTSSILAETVKRVGFRGLVVEPKAHQVLPSRDDGHEDEDEKEQCNTVDISDLLSEKVPILSGSAIRTGPDLKGTGWAGRTVNVQRVLGRWFRFRSEELGPEIV